MRTRDCWLITLTLFLVAFSPIAFFALGLVLNALFGCDIRDEGGTAYGDCPETVEDITYSLLISPWLLLMTVPAIGPFFVIALIASTVITVRRALKGRR